MSEENITFPFRFKKREKDTTLSSQLKLHHSLALRDGAQVSASTFGRGNAGNVTVRALDSVSLANNAAILSTVDAGGVGKGGNILDSSLQNIPMGVLYDKQQQKYLVEKCAIALTPGLRLFDPKPLQQVQVAIAPVARVVLDWDWRSRRLLYKHTRVAYRCKANLVKVAASSFACR